LSGCALLIIRIQNVSATGFKKLETKLNNTYSGKWDSNLAGKRGQLLRAIYRYKGVLTGEKALPLYLICSMAANQFST